MNYVFALSSFLGPFGLKVTTQTENLGPCNEMVFYQVPSLWRNKLVDFEYSEPWELVKIHLIAETVVKSTNVAKPLLLTKDTLSRPYVIILLSAQKF